MISLDGFGLLPEARLPLRGQEELVELLLAAKAECSCISRRSLLLDACSVFCVRWMGLRRTLSLRAAANFCMFQRRKKHLSTTTPDQVIYSPNLHPTFSRSRCEKVFHWHFWLLVLRGSAPTKAAELTNSEDSGGGSTSPYWRFC